MCRDALTIHQELKSKKGLCIETYCNNKKAPSRRICYACKSKRYAKRHPERYAFITLRNNAKRRGKEFSITFDQFKEFCKKTKILLGRGIEKNSLHIDRIDESKGYTIDNIQPLTNGENVKKYREYCYMTGTASTVTIRTNRNKIDCPF